MWLANRFQDLYSQLDHRYSTWIGPLLRHQDWPGTVAIAVVLSCTWNTVGQSLLPDVHQVAKDISLPIGTPLGRTAERTKNLESELAKDPDIPALCNLGL